jgi:hypothetical protein
MSIPLRSRCTAQYVQHMPFVPNVYLVLISLLV